MKIQSTYWKTNGKQAGWLVYLDNFRRVSLYLDGTMSQERYIGGKGWEIDFTEWPDVETRHGG